MVEEFNLKGVIIAGGSGTRLHPLTKITNKHLLPIYDKQMVFYPIQTMIESGIKDITIVGGQGHIGQFLELLASGYDMGINLSYVIQEKPMGVAHAIWVALREIGREDIFVMLGDNIVEENFKKDIDTFYGGAKIFLKEVSNPESYGVAYFKDNVITKIIEKPTNPKSNLAVIGAYMYDKDAYDIIADIEPSERGEVEVTALNNIYLEHGKLQYRKLEGYWKDVGTFEGIYQASSYVRDNR